MSGLPSPYVYTFTCVELSCPLPAPSFPILEGLSPPADILDQDNDCIL